MKIYSAGLDYYHEIEKAESGDTDAMIRVAFAILHGDKSEKLEPEEAERAIRYYKTAAEHGDKSAMLDLAACYMNGRGVPRNVQESLKWYERGWDPDNPGACFCLGCINRYDYLEDLSEVPTADEERIRKALGYFERGSELADSDCLYELGELYLKGKRVQKDERKAFALFVQAEDESDLEILSSRILRVYLRLAECWHYGIGTKKNIEIAYDYICLFREERRRREEAGEPEEDHIIERAETEWIAINRDKDTALSEVCNGNV